MVYLISIRCFYCFSGGKDGFVRINPAPKAILADISTFAQTGALEKTNT
jgi:hypothetical protein